MRNPADEAGPPPVRRPYPLVLCVFLSSFSALSFEIALTRVFSVSLRHHFAFMAISIGMLGIGLGGTLQAIFPQLRKRGLTGLYALLLGASIPLGYILVNLIPFEPARLTWDRVQVFYLTLYYLALCVPFLFFGLVVSTSLAARSGKSGLIYGADLLGAGAGSIASILLMALVGPERTIYVISLGALMGAFLMGNRRWPIAVSALLLALIIAAPEVTRIRISPYKGLQAALRYPGSEHIATYRNGFSRVDVFSSPLARYAPGLSLNYMEELPPQLGLSVDGSHITAITSAKGGKMDFLKSLPSALPYETGKRESALVIDPKGGLPVLLARQYRAGRVWSVESNPLVVEAIKEDFGEFSGGIYSHNTWTGLVRGRLRNTQETFDIIHISLTGAVPSASFGISEDYRFTVEAFRDYISRLRPEGVLSLSLFILPPPRTELRLLSTAIRAMEEMGIKETWKNIAAIRSWGSICMIIKPTPLLPREIAGIRRFSARNRFDLIYYPGIRREETNIYVKTPAGEYHDAFGRIINPATREEFKGGYLFDITEVYDDRPFFHYYLKLRNLRAIYELMGKKWQYFINEGCLLPAVLLQAAGLSLLLLFLPALIGRRRRLAPDAMLFYFALLGVGFMFIEVPLLQKLILPLENPMYAVALVLASILVSSGAGSLLSQRYGILRTSWSVLALAAFIIPYGLVLNTLVEYLLLLPLLERFVLSFALILPAGLLMGIPFPLGIRLLGEKNPAIIPWAWAVNGCFSVLSPILATMLAMVVGFKGVFLFGAGVYALAFGVLRRAT